MIFHTKRKQGKKLSLVVRPGMYQTAEEDAEGLPPVNRTAADQETLETASRSRGKILTKMQRINKARPEVFAMPNSRQAQETTTVGPKNPGQNDKPVWEPLDYDEIEKESREDGSKFDIEEYSLPGLATNSIFSVCVLYNK